ncbi:MAG: hypothetical protein QF535_07450, partial [Anaerolineales bacterium]|nr:hypothetical protein [Anaerolineales bacterium]
NQNGSNDDDQNWNTTYNLSSFGPWFWNVSVFDSDGFIINSSTQEIVLLELGISLNDTIVLSGTTDPVYVSGHINLSNGTNVSDNAIYVYRDGTLISSTGGDFIDTTDADFNLSYNMTNVTVEGTGDGANVTLNKTGVTVSFIAATDDTSNQASTYTFSGQSFGAAAANRQIVVVVQGAHNAGRTVSSMTIGGISAAQINRAGSSTNYPVEIWSAAVPTGASGSIVVVWSGSSNRASIGVWAMYGAETNAYAVADANNNPLSNTIDVPANGVIIGTAVDGFTGAGRASAWAWTNLDEDFELDSETTHLHTGASKTFAAAQTGLTITATPTGGPDEPVMALASWGPAYPPTGNLTSQAFDANSTVTFDSIAWANETPVDTNLTLYTRTSGDNVTWAAWTQQAVSPATIDTSAQYVQYKASFNTSNTSLTPKLLNITINYSGISTDSFGNYNYTFNAPSSAGTYTIKVNTTWDSNYVGENSVDLVVLNGSTFTKFDGETTDFNSTGNITSVANAILEKTEFGKITFLNNINASGVDFDSNVNITDN